MSERAFNSFVTALIGAIILAGVFALGGCTTLPSGAYGFAGKPQLQHQVPRDPAHYLDDCNAKGFPQCSGGN